MSLATNLQSFAVRAATEDKAIRSLVNGGLSDLSALNTSAKGSLVAAINELEARPTGSTGGDGATIDDGTTGTGSVWSSQKVQDSISAAVAAAIDGAPEALDTLNELAAALGDDANFAATVTSQLAGKVSVSAQTLTSAQQAQARANIGAVSAADIGDPNVDLLAVYESGL